MPRRLPATTLLPLLGVILLVAGLTLGLFLRFVQGLPTAVLVPPSARVTASADPLVSKVNRPALTQPVVRPTDFIYGDPGAAVRIIEFSDFACPYCQTMSAQLKAAVARHPEVQVVWKDFPLTSLHPAAALAHRAARCAGEQGKFWEYHDQLFALQDRLSRATELQIAGDLGLKPEAFSACLDDPSTDIPIRDNLAEGEALNLDGTPYLFVNDQPISGLLSDEELDQVIALHSRLKR